MAALNRARRHVRATLDGLNDEDLRRATTPSGWTLLGMVQHLALDVECFWFRSVDGHQHPVVTKGPGESTRSRASSYRVRDLTRFYWSQPDFRGPTRVHSANDD